MSALQKSGQEKPVRVNLFGLPGAGKTTLLYRLRLGETVSTIPTTGFNIETIETKDGKDIVIWDFSGSSHRPELLHYYVQEKSLSVFVHDCSRPERLEDSLKLLRTRVVQMVGKEVKHLWILFNKQDLVPMAERSAVIAGLKERFETEMDQYDDMITTHFLKPSGTSAVTGIGVDNLLTDLQKTVQEESGKGLFARPSMESRDPSFVRPRSDEEFAPQAEKLSEEIEDSVTFWRDLRTAGKDKWDHLTFVQAAYSVLVSCLAKGGGILDCAEDFAAELKRLGTTERDGEVNMTMIIFWMLQIHRAAVDSQTDRHLDALPTQDDFREVFLQTPSLLDENSWARYYTATLLFSPRAHKEWCPPNIRSLRNVRPPQLLRDDSMATTPTGEFNQDLIRFAFCSVHRSMLLLSEETPRTRGAVLREALFALEVAILREKRELLPAVFEGAGQGLTPASQSLDVRTRRWIQMVRTALESLEKAEAHEKIAWKLSSDDFKVILMSMGGLDWWKQQQHQREYPFPETSDAATTGGEEIAARFPLGDPEIEPHASQKPSSALPSPRVQI